MIIGEGCFNEVKDDLVIENYPNLEKIIVKKYEIVYDGEWEKGIFKIESGREFHYKTKEVKEVELKTVEISNESELRSLLEDKDRKEKVKELIVKDKCCNDMEDDLEISGFDNLEKIVFKKDCLRNLNSLKICNNENLKIIEIEDTDTNDGALENVEKVVIESN